jgi:hypothetical protein
MDLNSLDLNRQSLALTGIEQAAGDGACRSWALGCPNGRSGLLAALVGTAFAVVDRVGPVQRHRRPNSLNAIAVLSVR